MALLLDYPVKTVRLKPNRLRFCVVIESEKGFIPKATQHRSLANLTTYPLVMAEDLRDGESELLTPEEQMTRIRSHFKRGMHGLTLAHLKPVPVKPVTHVFTHERTITFVIATIVKDKDLALFPR